MHSSTSPRIGALLSAGCAFLLSATTAAPAKRQSGPIALRVPDSASGGSIEHTNSFSSFSFEPAFWVEFFGNASEPNAFTFDVLERLVERGSQPQVRPGGITMDSMIFDPSAGDPVRTTNEDGGVYRTTVGPAYYESWSNFPNGTKFVSTLNFGNNSYNIARGMALASVGYQADKIAFFELGNEPTNYNASRWNSSTEAYVQQWKNWTGALDTVINQAALNHSVNYSTSRWWASSATTDETPLHVRPADIIPAGVDSANQVAEYSIHNYAFSSCDPERLVLATISNILNHTALAEYADVEIMPSAEAALDSGKPWIIGEFNSISCSGRPGVSDTFAQALWTVDVELIYAARNASAVYLHQGATLVFQSSEQFNTPGFSTYSFLYPRDTEQRGVARVLPGFSGLLFVAEAMAASGTRVATIATPEGVDPDRFSAYAFYLGDELDKIALLNMRPYYANSTDDGTIEYDISECGKTEAWVKRMTAPYTDEGNTSSVTWAGQSFENGNAVGEVETEVVENGIVKVRASEAVLVFFNEEEMYTTS